MNEEVVTNLLDLGPLVDLLVEALAAMVLAVGGWTIAWLGRRLKLAADAEVRAYLERALQAGVGFAAERARAAGGDLARIDVRSELVREAAAYVVARTPDALARFGIGPAALADMVLARLPREAAP